MSMYWILFIGIAIISYIVQASLQSKFKVSSINSIYPLVSDSRTL